MKAYLKRRMLVIEAQNRVEACLLKSWFKKTPQVSGFEGPETVGGKRTWHDKLIISFRIKEASHNNVF